MNRLVGLIILTGIFLTVFLPTLPPIKPKVGVVAPKLHQDKSLVKIAKQLGIDYSKLNMTYAKNPKADDIKGVPTAAYFQAPNNIVIRSAQPIHAQQVYLAYEYLHYRWLNMPSSQKTKMTKLYQRYYNADANFRYLTRHYVGGADTLADERNSTACTKVGPSLLTPSFNKYCNGLIPHRPLLFR